MTTRNGTKKARKVSAAKAKAYAEAYVGETDRQVARFLARLQGVTKPQEVAHQILTEAQHMVVENRKGFVIEGETAFPSFTFLLTDSGVKISETTFERKWWEPLAKQAQVRTIMQLTIAFRELDSTEGVIVLSGRSRGGQWWTLRVQFNIVNGTPKFQQPVERFGNMVADVHLHEKYVAPEGWAPLDCRHDNVSWYAYTAEQTIALVCNDCGVNQGEEMEFSGSPAEQTVVLGKLETRMKELDGTKVVRVTPSTPILQANV